MIKKHLSQIINGLIVAIVGGLSVYYITSNAKAPESTIITETYIKNPQELTPVNYSKLKIEISGSSNRIFLGQGKTAIEIENISLSGSSKDLSFNIPPNYSVGVNLSGSSNSLQISSELRDLIFINDSGSSNHIYYTDE